MKPIRLLINLILLLSLLYSQSFSFALIPLSKQTEDKKRYTLAEAYVDSREDLKLLISDYGLTKESLIALTIAKNNLDGSIIKATDSRFFTVEAEISSDGVLEVKLVDGVDLDGLAYDKIFSMFDCKYIGIQEGIDEIPDAVLFNLPSHTTLAIPVNKLSYNVIRKKLNLIEQDGSISDVVLGVDDSLCIDLELEDVIWSEASSEDMTKLGIGTQLMKLLMQNLPSFKGDQYVVNKPTNHQIINRKPQNLYELKCVFEQTPIGKIMKKCGISSYVFKYIARPSVRMYDKEELILVDDTNLSEFMKWTTLNETFLVEAIKEPEIANGELILLDQDYVKIIETLKPNFNISCILKSQ
jgi:hypothetical protein